MISRRQIPLLGESQNRERSLIEEGLVHNGLLLLASSTIASFFIYPASIVSLQCVSDTSKQSRGLGLFARVSINNLHFDKSTTLRFEHGSNNRNAKYLTTLPRLEVKVSYSLLNYMYVLDAGSCSMAVRIYSLSPVLLNVSL